MIGCFVKLGETQSCTNLFIFDGLGKNHLKDKTLGQEIAGTSWNQTQGYHWPTWGLSYEVGVLLTLQKHRKN